MNSRIKKPEGGEFSITELTQVEYCALCDVLAKVRTDTSFWWSLTDAQRLFVGNLNAMLNPGLGISKSSPI